MAKRRTSGKKKAKPSAISSEITPPRPIAEDLVDGVVALLVNIRSRAEVRRLCADDLLLTPAETAAAIDEATRRIRLAAAVDFDHELGAAKTRLESLYERADPRTALAVQKEISKLLGLYPRGGKNGAGPDTADDGDALAQLAAARAHLAPLVAAGDDEPLDEIARRVVSRFTKTDARKTPR